MADRLPTIAFPGASAELPAREALAFNDAWLSRITIDTASTGTAIFWWRRYNYATGRILTERESQELGVDAEVPTRVDNLWGESAKYPEVTKAVVALLTIASTMNELLPARQQSQAAETAVSQAQAAVEAAQVALDTLPPESTPEEVQAAQEAKKAADEVLTAAKTDAATKAASLTAVEAKLGG